MYVHKLSHIVENFAWYSSGLAYTAGQKVLIKFQKKHFRFWISVIAKATLPVILCE